MDSSDPIPPPPSFGPVAKADRLVNLDFAHGMALLGINVVNSAALFGPLAALMPNYWSQGPLHDRVAAFLVMLLFQGKFVAQFSLLFGYGLLGQLEKADAAGRGAVGFAFRRLLPLLAFGLIHALAIWYGDILFFYATMGFWLLLARRVSARGLLLIGLTLLVIAFAIGAVFIVLTQPGEMAGSDDPWPAAKEIAAYRDGPWWEAQKFRLGGWLLNVAYMVLAQGWFVLAFFFLGGLLWRVRFFAPEQRGLRLRVLSICLPLGLLFELIAAALLWPYPPASLTRGIVGHLVQELGVLLLPFGYLAGSALLAEALPGWIRDPVASAGRMSLTVYLSMSLIATGLAYHWGFRLFGSVGALQEVLLALGIWLGMVTVSFVWLKRFKQGPMEWLWRRLEYGRSASAAPRPE